MAGGGWTGPRAGAVDVEAARPTGRRSPPRAGALSAEGGGDAFVGPYVCQPAWRPTLVAGGSPATQLPWVDPTKNLEPPPPPLSIDGGGERVAETTSRSKTPVSGTPRAALERYSGSMELPLGQDSQRRHAAPSAAVAAAAPLPPASRRDAPGRVFAQGPNIRSSQQRGNAGGERALPRARLQISIGVGRVPRRAARLTQPPSASPLTQPTLGEATAPPTP